MKKWSVLFSQLLKKRKIDEGFLMPKYDELEDPLLLPDMSEAVERIVQAGELGEKVLIYGDYDVDGVTASVVMKEALAFAGVNEVEVLLPDRFVDGYGMGVGVADEALKRGIGLVVTVDCGSGSGEAISKLKKAGIDCVVTDHHEITEAPKDAIAVVNPKRGAVGLDLAGVGVAFKLAQAINARMNKEKCDGQEKWLLDLVAIGTICDSVALTDENRILVKYGMKVLQKTRRTGLQELMKVAGVKRIDSKAIGFQIGPRLNASGRMKSARASLDLLLASGKMEAFALAKELDDWNKERKKTQNEAMYELEARGIDDSPVIVVRGEWHEGVIGIVAGRLMEKYEKPSFVLTETGEGLLKGSGRSFGDFALADCITNCKKLLVKGGGHNFACGVTIANSNFEAFSEAVNKYYAGLGLRNQKKFLTVQEDLSIEEFSGLTEQLYEEIDLLSPFGEGNKEPVFKLKNSLVLSVGAMGADKKHLRMVVRDKEGKTIKLVAFYAPDAWFKIEEEEKVDVLVNIELNEWNGVRTVEGRILGIERTGEI